MNLIMITKSLKNSIEKNALLPTYRFLISPNFLVSLIVVAIMLAIIFMSPAFGASSSTGAYVNHLYTEFNGNQYTYGFKICAGDLDIHNPMVFVSSDSQTITVTSDNTINAGKCSKTFGVQIRADNPKSILATLIDSI